MKKYVFRGKVISKLKSDLIVIGCFFGMLGLIVLAWFAVCGLLCL